MSIKGLLVLLAVRPPSVVYAATININTANATLLDTLPGIGPTKVAAIVDYRTKNGPFVSVEDIEKMSGMSLFAFLKARIFDPLQMTGVVDTDSTPLESSDSKGYVRYGLGPLHEATRAAKGWLFGAGQLAMTAEDLAKWDLSILHQRLLKPASYVIFETDNLLKNGLAVSYGLGIGVRNRADHRALVHTGNIPGFVAQNWIFPDDQMAVLILLNFYRMDAVVVIADDIVSHLIPLDQKHFQEMERLTRKILLDFQTGQIDPGLFSETGKAYYTPQIRKEIGLSLQALGTPHELKQISQRAYGPLTFHEFNVKFDHQSLYLFVSETTEGKIEEFLIRTLLPD